MGPRFEPSSKSCPGLGQWGSSPRPDRPNVTPVCYICKLSILFRIQLLYSNLCMGLCFKLNPGMSTSYVPPTHVGSGCPRPGTLWTAKALPIFMSDGNKVIQLISIV